MQIFKKILRIVLILAVVLALLAGAFLAGAYLSAMATTTFCATIEETDGSNFLVQGLDTNDINSRGAFTFTLHDSTMLVWRHTEITPDDLDAGDTVAITYAGSVLETFPSRIRYVLKVQLLDDEK